METETNCAENAAEIKCGNSVAASVTQLEQTDPGEDRGAGPRVRTSAASAATRLQD